MVSAVGFELVDGRQLTVARRYAAVEAPHKVQQTPDLLASELGLPGLAGCPVCSPDHLPAHRSTDIPLACVWIGLACTHEA